MASKASLENALRSEVIEVISKALSDHFDCDIITVGSGEISIPVVDAEGNDKYPKIKVSIPRGTRNGNGGYDPYDGYAVAEDYALDCEEKAQKKADAEAKKQAKIAKDEQKRAEKKALADANKNLKELRKIKLTENKEEADNYANEYAPHELADMLN
jgi:hypothetical protein